MITLRKLINENMDEGETKRANKAKKRAAGFTKAGLSRAMGDSPLRDIDLDNPDDLASLEEPKDADWTRRQDASDAAVSQKIAGGRSRWGGVDRKDKASSFQTPTQKNRQRHRVRAKGPDGQKASQDFLLGRGQQDPAYRNKQQWQGTDFTGKAKGVVVPTAVQQAASKAAGGKVVFGRYYDAQGNYLGRSQGGKWIDGKTDPNAKTQLEMYNKLMEIEATKYKIGDRKLVKDMVREVVRSCG